MLDRIKNKLKTILNENTNTGINPTDDTIGSGVSLRGTNKGAGIVGKAPIKNKQGRVLPADYTSVDKGTIDAKRKNRLNYILNNIKDNKYKVGLDLFKIEPTEILSIAKNVIKTKLNKQTHEDIIDSIDKEIDDLKNENGKEMKEIIPILKDFNDIIETAANIGGGGRGNLDKLNITFLLPSGNDIPSNIKLYDVIRASFMEELRNPAHILHLYLNDTEVSKFANVPDVHSEEDLMKKMSNLKTFLENLFPKITEKNIKTKIINAIKRITNIETHLNNYGYDPKQLIGSKEKMPEYINTTYEKIQEIKNMITPLAEAVAAKSPKSIEDRVAQFFVKLKNSTTFTGFQKTKQYILEVFKKLRNIEINNAIIHGLRIKQQRVKQLRSRTHIPTTSTKPIAAAQPTSAEFVNVVSSIDEFDPDNDYVVVNDDGSPFFETIIHESQQPTRQRKITRKTALQEVWKKHKQNIQKQTVQQPTQHNMPDIHLGGLS